MVYILYITLFAAAFALRYTAALTIGGVDLDDLKKRAKKCGMDTDDLETDQLVNTVLSDGGRKTKLHYLTQHLFPKLPNSDSCLTKTEDPLARLMMTPDDVRIDLEECQKHMLYRVNALDGCVHKVDGKYYDTWANSPLTLLEQVMTLQDDKDRVVDGVFDHELECGKENKADNMRRLVVIRQRCQKLRLLLLNPLCKQEDLLTVFAQGSEIEDCTYDKLTAPTIGLVSLKLDECVKENKVDC